VESRRDVNPPQNKRIIKSEVTMEPLNVQSDGTLSDGALFDLLKEFHIKLPGAN
jgi:hypothetical protein